MFSSRFVRVFVVPGAVFQSVMIGGGYGTGREIVEFFTSFGLLGGLLGLCVAFLVLSLVLALTFELARSFRVYVVVLGSGWEPIAASFSEGEIVGGWWRSGFKYALYNLAVAPLLLYVARGFETRAETLTSGVVAGAIAMVPAVMFHISFFAAYPGILDQALPVYWLIAEMGRTWLLVMFSVVLFGTFIETGAGMLQGINERIDTWLEEQRGKGLGRTAHAALAVSAIVVSALLSLWGITALIAQGYGTIAWGFFAVYMVPLVMVGTYRIKTARNL